MKILLGITGSIAAYKSAMLIRLLVKAGHEVKVIMTESAKSFITPLTLSTLSHNPVFSTFEKDETGLWNNHVELGLWADLMVVAPCSAHTLSKMSSGHCDNLLIACYLSARCPVAVAPAMDLDMWAHPSTQSNLQLVGKHGVFLIEPGTGELASGLSGKGRMAEPEQIAEFVENFGKKTLRSKKVLLTVGPTHEYIDPVRYITNASTGKMGLAIADALHRIGAEVIVVHGPINFNSKPYKMIPVVSASNMAQQTLGLYPSADVAIFTAAVADFTPFETAAHKIKKSQSDHQLLLTKTIDIALEAGKLKRPDQINVGFALETENESQNALLKLESKNFDLLVLNSLSDQGAGFGHHTNKVSFFTKNMRKDFPLKAKTEVAVDIVEMIEELIKSKF